MEASSLQMLEALKLRCFQDVGCEISTRTGGVADSIVEFAREMHADLIVIPTRGFGPPRPFLIGSVTAKVLHDALCPVWISPHPKELGPFLPIGKLAVAMEDADQGNSIRKALISSILLCCRFGDGSGNALNMEEVLYANNICKC